MSIEMNNRLPVLADSLRHRFDKLNVLHDSTFEEEMKIAAELLEAKECHSDNTAFHHWLVDVDLMDRISKDDRAGYILMGRHPDLAREAYDCGTRSPDSIGRKIRAELDRRPSSELPKMPPTPSSPAESRPAPAPAGESASGDDAKNDSATTTRDRPSRIAMLIGHELGDPVFRRIGSGPTLKLLCDIGDRNGGKAVVRRFAQTLIDHPAWTPTRQSKTVSARMLNAGIGKALEFKSTPAGLERAIDAALNREHRAAQPAPVAAPAPAEAASSNVVPIAGRRFEVPSADEAIAIYGTAIRQAGERPDDYLDEWATFRMWELIDGMLRHALPSIPARGVVYAQAGVFFKDVHPRAGQFFARIGVAMRDCRDPTAGCNAAAPRYRVK